MPQNSTKKKANRTRSIRVHLSGAFATMVGLVILAAGMGLVGVRLQQRTFQNSLEIGFTLNELTLQARSDMNTVQRLVTSFLASYEEDGLETAYNTYLASVDVHIADIEQTLLPVDEMGLVDADGEPVSVTHAVQYIGSYQNGTERMVGQIEARGVRDEGLIGAFNGVAETLKSRIARQEDYRLQQLMVELEESEKDYFYYGTAVDETLESIISSIKQRFELINPEVYQETGIEGVAEQYLTTFQAVVEADDQIHRTIISNQAQIARLNSELDTLETQAAALIEAGNVALADRGKMVSMMVIATTFVAVLMGAFIAIISTRLITRPLRHVAQTTQAFADGNLDERVTIHRNDEIGQVGDTFNNMAATLQDMLREEQTNRATLEETIARYMIFIQAVAAGDLTMRLDLDEAGSEDDLYRLGDDLNGMVESLRQMTEQVRLAATRLSTAAAEILAATTQQNASVSEQDAAITQTMATLEEVRTTIHQTAQRADIVAQTAQQSVSLSYTGRESVNDSVVGMQLLQEQVDDIARSILALSEQTQQIGVIIDSVSNIADQSKLLALNASIEAARAGEGGRGFSVVALEVRQLAEQSQEATSRIGEILHEIQQTTNTAVMVTEEGTKGADSAVDLVGDAGSAIDGLTSIIEQAAQAVQQIAASTGQQINGMDQLIAAMNAIRQAANEATASASQTEQSAQALTDMAREMEDAVARYRL